MSITETRNQRIQQIKARLGVLADTASRTWWEFGALFSEVKREELWRDDGAESFPAWLDGLGWERETARKAMLVAANFTPEMAETYGTEKLAAAVGYLDATRKEERPGELGALRVRYQAKNGQFKTVPFPKATVAQVKAATRLVTGASRRTSVRPAAVVAFDARVAQLEEAMPAAPTGTHRGKRVEMAMGLDGRPAVTFHAIPIDDLEAFFEAVRRTLLRAL